MCKLLILICLLVVIVACNSTQAVSDNKIIQNSNLTSIDLKPKSKPLNVSIELKLDAKQSKELNKAIPANIREILENAEEFEILAEVENKDGKLVYPVKEGAIKPNLKAEISDADTRKEILEYFYRDVAKGSAPANCWIPHHILRAKLGENIVEMEICFSCSRFSGKSSFGEFSGTTGRGDEKTENLFNRILENQGSAIE